MSVARFCSSWLWRRCGVLNPPQQIIEEDYERPKKWTTVKSFEEAPTYGDVEETAMWLGGAGVFQSVLEAVCANVRFERHSPILVHHPTGYEGSLEKSIISLPPTLSERLGVSVIGSMTWCPSLEMLQYCKLQITSVIVDNWKNISAHSASPP